MLSEPIVIVRLGSRPPQTRLTDGSPSGTLHFDGTDFSEMVVGRRDFVGFYDWLRTPDRHVVGVQFILAEDWAVFASMLSGLRDVELLTSHIFRILFVPHATIDEEASTDQEFGITRVFRAHNELAFSIDAGALDEQE